MAFDYDTLRPFIHQILSAPGTDLETISAKRVRRQLLELDSSLTADFLKENKEDVDAVIAAVFEKVSEARGVGGSADAGDSSSKRGTSSHKRKQEVAEDDDIGDEEGDTPPPKRVKKAGKQGRELSDAELARKLSSEINSRSRRAGGKNRATNGSPKKASRSKKSAATVNSDDDSDDADSKQKTRRKSTSSTGGAKGGFAKEYSLSDPLAAVLHTNKLSRLQVVKHLWIYIKDKDLQNPSNKQEIICDPSLKAVFGVDKINMFKMNKVLGQHLHEIDA